MKILVAGSSGLIGRATVAALKQDDHSVSRLVRGPATAKDEVSWNPAFGDAPAGAIAEFDAVINLCGESIVQSRWTSRRMAVLRASRIDPTQTLAKTLRNLAGAGRGPKLFINASAIGYYGDRGSLELNEATPPGSGFLAGLCKDWEDAAQVAAPAGIRVVCLRFGIVLSKDGGTLEKLTPFYRAGLGGVLGSGMQWMSWLSMDDVVGAIRFVLGTNSIEGPVNLVAPASVTNAAFHRALVRIFGHQLSMPVPRTALRLVYGAVADEALLASARVVPAKLQAAGYPFRYKNLEDALYEALAMEKDEV